MKCDERRDEVNENLSLIQKRDGLTFGTDAYLLYAYLKQYPHGVGVELGAGTGIVSLLALTKGKVVKVHAVEVQPSFAELCRINGENNRLAERMPVIGKDLRDVTLQDTGEEADLVFSNPPYMLRGHGLENPSEERNAARREVFGGIDDFCAAAKRLLKTGGHFVVVYRPERLPDLFGSLCRHGLTPKRMTAVYYRKDHPASTILLEACKGGSPGLYLTPPLLLDEGMGEQRIPTSEYRYIYENGEFYECYHRPGRKK